MDALVRAVIADLPSIKKRRISVSAYVTQIFSSIVKTASTYQIPPSAVIGWEKKPRDPPFVDLDNSSPAET